MSLNHSPAIVTDGLVLCLDAANIRSYPKSGTTWSDLVGTNNGTLTNMDAANFSSDNGGSLSFDGSDEGTPTGTSGASTLCRGFEFRGFCCKSCRKILCKTARLLGSVLRYL